MALHAIKTTGAYGPPRAITRVSQFAFAGAFVVGALYLFWPVFRLMHTTHRNRLQITSPERKNRHKSRIAELLDQELEPA